MWPLQQLLNNLDRDSGMCITLITLTMAAGTDDHTIALKLNKKCAQPSQEKL